MYKKMGVLFTLTMFLFFILPTASFTNTSEMNTQNNGHLRGFIYKSDNKTPLWGAQVVLQGVKTQQVFRSNVTDSTGDYEVLDVPAGNYIVTILAKNKIYKVKSVDFLIKIVEQKTTIISFSLKKSIMGFLFFLLRPCCLATIISGTTIGLAVGKSIKEEAEQSPTQI
jgi:hypothetical protein